MCELRNPTKHDVVFIHPILYTICSVWVSRYRADLVRITTITLHRASSSLRLQPIIIIVFWLIVYHLILTVYDWTALVAGDMCRLKEWQFSFEKCITAKNTCYVESSSLSIDNTHSNAVTHPSAYASK